ncbi:hypothetical protein PAXINDRAFT_100143 [Paxillus involutus ATCC 200175]|uniref:Uncharacterized protein n=1 Tax=Paxillus involutus ATCC 200175 TaxID=664439 RepID=A0A0C9SXG0_PAXIN|nr:hypothetical protein PAXINDRAFT_100143 [Paxillus involutus ATCC 200175]
MIKDPSEVIRPLRTLPDGVPVCLRTGPGDWRRESRKPDADRSSIVLARLLGLRFLEGRIPLLRANKRSQERSALAGTFGGRVFLRITPWGGLGKRVLVGEPYLEAIISPRGPQELRRQLITALR